MELEFLGAAGTVTGSRTVVRAGGASVLVDCGLFQGLKHLRERNWEPLPVARGSLDAVVLTHAHLDHSGLVPVLVRDGYDGPVYASPGTIELCEILWPDSGRLQEEDAAYAARRGFSKHRPPRALYTERDAERALRSLVALPAGEDVTVRGAVTVRLAPAGHILGATSVHLADGVASVLFSGDLGRGHDLVMAPPSSSVGADTVVLESTYGDRRHPDTDPVERLGEVVRATAARGGVVLVPAFAVGRAQALLVALGRLRRHGEIPKIPVFLDSPMAIAATQAYLRHAGEERLGPDEVDGLTSTARALPSVEESKGLNHLRGPAVIVSAAGMLTGGRVLHHLVRLAPDPRNTLLFVGYQAAGTRGASILAGEPSVKVHGAFVPVRARIEQLDAFSAHADQQELLDWVASLAPAPKTVVLNHGEPAAAEALRRRVEQDLGVPCRVATDGRRITISGSAVAPARTGSPVLSPPAMRAVGADPETDERGARLARILASASYVRADRDLELLASDEMRGARLMLEFLKTDLGLRRAGIDALIPVFGSSRIRDPAEEDLTESERRWSGFYGEARALGHLVSSEPFDGGRRAVIVTGGGPGIMEAANRGAADAGAPTIGLNITLAHEQVPNPYLTPELTFQFRYFGIRKMHFLERAVALVAFPGGFGTADELYETLTLLQSEKLTPIPVVLVGRDYWARALPLDFLVREGFVDASDHANVIVVDGAAEAWATIRAFYRDRPAPGHEHLFAGDE